MFSLSANIYLPCMSLLQKDTQTDTQLMKLTTTAYIIDREVASVFWGEFSDKFSRQPIYILVLGIYVATSIGLAAKGVFVAFLSLQMLQSLRAFATVATGYGMVADMVTPAESAGCLVLVCWVSYCLLFPSFYIHFDFLNRDDFLKDSLQSVPSRPYLPSSLYYSFAYP